MKAAPIFITSLADKRERFIAERDYHQSRADKAADAIAKIDATLALFEEGKWVRSERRSYRENPGPFAWRELPRLVIEVLRDAGRPMPTRDITQAIIERSGVVLDSDRERKALRKRVTDAVNDKCRQGVVRSAGIVGLLNQWVLDPDGENKRAEAHRARNAARSERRRKR